MKWFTIGLGTLISFIGLIWLFNPLGTVSFLAWVLAFTLLAAAISQISFYFSLAPEFRNFWSLLQSIFSIVFALIIFGMSSAERSDFLLTLVGIWAIIIGITRIIMGNSLKNSDFSGSSRIVTTGAWAVGIGVLLLLVPLLFSAFIGYLAAFFMLAAGTSLIVTGLQLP